MSGSACCLIFLSSFLPPFFAFYQSVYFFLSWLFFLKYHLENVVLEIRILTGVHPPVYLLFGLFIDQRGEKSDFLNEFSVLASDLVTGHLDLSFGGLPSGCPG